jgi:hypothetical protein
MRAKACTCKKYKLKKYKFIQDNIEYILGKLAGHYAAGLMKVLARCGTLNLKQRPTHCHIYLCTKCLVVSKSAGNPTSTSNRHVLLLLVLLLVLLLLWRLLLKLLPVLLLVLLLRQLLPNLLPVLLVALLLWRLLLER